MPRPAFPKKKKPAVSSPKKKPSNNPFSSRAFAMVVYGPPGVGKTAFAAQFPNPSFIIDPREEGIHDLIDFKKVPKPISVTTAESFDDLLSVIPEVAGDGETQTLILDSASGMEQLCFNHHCENYFDGDWSKEGFLSFQQGPKNAAKVDWPRLLSALDDARKDGINIILVAHSQIKVFQNPEGPDFERYIPSLDKAIWDQTHRWCACEIFYNYEIEVIKEGKRKAKANTEAAGRFIYTEQMPAFDAKNRWGLSPVIEAGSSAEEAYSNFVEDYQRAKGE